MSSICLSVVGMGDMFEHSLRSPSIKVLLSCCLYDVLS